MLLRQTLVSGLVLSLFFLGNMTGQNAVPKPSAGIKPPDGKAPAEPSPHKVDVLRQLSSSFEEISQRSGRAVVQIFVRGFSPATGSGDSNGLLTPQNSSGSGIIMTPDGYILTNAHVVNGAHSMKVQLNFDAEAEAQKRGDRTMNRPIPGTLVGIDRDSDLAVIKIDRTNLPFLAFGDSDELKQGQLVLALGNPLGLDNSVSVGVVSAIARQIKPQDPMVYIQTDAPINPGNSGGPLIDADGRVVGINTFILTQSGGSEGIGFAIPSSIAKEVYEQLKKQGHVHRAQLGLVGATITEQMAEGLKLETDHGVIVSDLEPNGPAAHGGLQVDDVIVGLNGKRVSSVHQLNANIFRLKPGTQVSVRVQRGADQVDLSVITEEQSGAELDALADMVDPSRNVIADLGIVGMDITKPILDIMPDLRRPGGVVIAARKENAPYSGPPLQVGDVIYSVNRNVINNVDQLKDTMNRIKSASQPAVLLLERDKHLLYVTVELD